MMKQWFVDVIESERGWGQTLDSTESFTTLEEAKKFQEEFNKRNTAATAPDWYMYATDPYQKEGI